VRDAPTCLCVAFPLLMEVVQAPVLLFGGAAGVWLFYDQHQFDPSYWARTGEWESMDGVAGRARPGAPLAVHPVEGYT
jgi:fatty acid desaturase